MIDSHNFIWASISLAAYAVTFLKGMDTWSYSGLLMKSLLMIASIQLMSAIHPSDYFPFDESGQNSALGSGSGSGIAST